MQKFRSVYQVTEKFIGNNPTFIIQDDETIVGFWGVLIDDKEASLEYLFIEPRSIGKGYGKLLWNHTVNHCNMLGIKELIIVSGPKQKSSIQKWGQNRLMK
jgi:N-acetylglutamate synthase-like GNAT family acetyltransferase